jgi:hypothetical protein
VEGRELEVDYSPGYYAIFFEDPAGTNFKFASVRADLLEESVGFCET